MQPRRLLHSSTIVALLALAALLWLLPRGERTGEGSCPRCREEHAPGAHAAAAGPSAVATALAEPDRAERSSPGAARELATPAPAPSADSSAALRARVQDARGAGVADARVRLVPPRPAYLREPRAVAERRTAADGTFPLSAEEARELWLCVDAPGFVSLGPLPAELRQGAGSDPALAPLVLARAAVLEGLVRDERGLPVAGALLREARRESPAEGGLPPRELARSGADGTFRIDVLPPGPWALAVSAPGFRDGRFAGDSTQGSARPIELLLERGATLAGRVSGIPSGAGELAVRAFPLRAAPPDAPPDAADARGAPVGADGRFVLEGLEPGSRWLVEAFLPSPGGAPAADGAASSFAGASRSARVRATAGEPDLLLAWDEGSSLRLRAVDAASGEPVEHFELELGFDVPLPRLEAGGRPRTHHPDGRALVEGLRAPEPELPLRLVVRSPEHRPWSRDDLRLAPGENDLGTLRLERAALARVRVLDGSSGAPVAGARVWLAPLFPDRRGAGLLDYTLVPGSAVAEKRIAGARSVRSDAGGVARLGAPDAPAALLRVEADGYAPYEEPDLVVPASGLERDVLLDRGATLLVRVTADDGRPLAGVELEHRTPAEVRAGAFPLPGLHARTVTDASGDARFGPLERGTHQVRTKPRGGRPILAGAGGEGALPMAGVLLAGAGEWTDVPVEAGEEILLTLVAEAEASLEGVVREDGVPLAGARVVLVEADVPALPGLEAGTTVRTDESGRFRLDARSPGPHRLRIAHPSRLMDDERALRLAAGVNTLVVDLPVTRVSGRIVDVEGRPLAGARVGVRPRDGSAGGLPGGGILVMEAADGSSLRARGPAAGPSTETDADGRYELRGLAADTPLVVLASGVFHGEARSQELELAPGSHRRGVDLALAPAGVLLVEATLRGGGTPPACAVRAVPAEPGSEPASALLEASRASLEGLRPGRWSVLLTPLRPTPETGSGQRREVEVVAGERTLLRFELP